MLRMRPIAPPAMLTIRARAPASRTANATIYGTVQLPSKRAGFVSQGNDYRTVVLTRWSLAQSSNE